MKPMILAAALVLAVAADELPAQNYPGSSVAPTAEVSDPRGTGDLSWVRPAYQDATLAGGEPWQPPREVEDPCETDPHSAACNPGPVPEVPNTPYAVIAGCSGDAGLQTPWQEGGCSTTRGASRVSFFVGHLWGSYGRIAVPFAGAEPPYELFWGGVCADARKEGVAGEWCHLEDRAVRAEGAIATVEVWDRYTGNRVSMFTIQVEGCDGRLC